MSISILFGLLGGLALFLYGMQMMSTNLEAVAGSRMKGLLEKLSSNRLLGVIVGAVITALIQSSSGTTVMVVGFVNSGLMTLRQAVWIIMGANIGTTITGQLVALDIGVFMPFVAFIGVAVLMFSKDKKVQSIASIVAGLGILFMGLDAMSAAMEPLRDLPEFINLITKFSNPLLGIMAGALFTAAIQSSAASVGILQALAVSGVIGLDSAVFVLFGQNIGTCITAVLASIGANRNAKRTTVIHLLFNVIGTTIFVIIALVTPFVPWIESLTPTNPAGQIANVHTVFNIVTTLLLLPFGEYLAKAAEMILPERAGMHSGSRQWYRAIGKPGRALGSSAIAVQNLLEQTGHMMDAARENVNAAFEMFLTGETSDMQDIEDREEQIDLYNVEISERISDILAVEQSVSEIEQVNCIFNIIGNIERIGDHAVNLAEYAQTMKEKGYELSKKGRKEVERMQENCREGLGALRFEQFDACKEILDAAIQFEQQTDEESTDYRSRQIRRIGKKECSMESAILYSELLVDYERIGDHALNIAQNFAKIQDV
ncbi:Na/Pi cotransporter family protein [Coprococcus sp. AF21-14LB]|uniref:Na/Pi cotransporter family protein n=1 Tax=Coprococcus sp. AF21-14LB TaxID=2292231 RepID=UPI000E53539D|nr:Na/Pi cotransporter family protein [Coprococcus sp. AF21-14LB]RGS80570.1 Na/Pi cotransporter family protein [Coprococcus sp. AF21-14LB]